ncbi:TetR/AcrR family transcriptional regulator [Actinospica sp.]|uniref:TetR/AcrR family transcriptional regulator n=1 Tax=Actinospica sp. TaxID=1872142 RepID=UPI002C6A8CA9|nr:TetR family transcriptional regulator [Actinospica sp.]HWG26747.1 TetR family transcriptional regulator [Actinospica sp.]
MELVSGPAAVTFGTAKLSRPLWPHQQRALDAFERDRARGDAATYLVVPPGGGKTLIGLEAARRLARPTVVLCPNTAIQGQWIAQWQTAFSSAAAPATTSRELPTALTVLTYQAVCTLDSAGNGDARDRADPLSLLHSNGRALIDRLRAGGPWTLSSTSATTCSKCGAAGRPGFALTNQMNVCLIQCMGRIAGVTAAETRERLLRAAADVFAQRGYDGTRVADIAAAAGVSNGALYAHFGSKADLLTDALRTHGRRLLADLFAADPSRSVTDLLLLIGRWLPRCRDARGYLIVEALVAARRDEDVARPMRDYVGERADSIAGLMRVAQAGGELDPALSPNALAHFCLLLSMGSALVTPDLHAVDEEEWVVLLARVVTGLARPGITAQGVAAQGVAAQGIGAQEITPQAGATQ